MLAPPLTGAGAPWGGAPHRLKTPALEDHSILSVVCGWVESEMWVLQTTEN